MTASDPVIGVLALQGDVREHLVALAGLGVTARPIRRAAELVRAEPDGPQAVAAFAAEVAGQGPLDRESFRGAVQRARAATGLKGRVLLHPLRVALTAADSGPELDLAVPAIDRVAGVEPGAGLAPARSCAARVRDVAAAVSAG